MAYISVERVKEIRNTIKKEFPDFKFSIRFKYHHSGLSVSIIQGPVDFGKSYEQVNHDYIDKHYADNEPARKVLKRIYDIISPGCYDRNAGDMGADYSDMTFFIDIEIGQWDKPYIFK